MRCWIEVTISRPTPGKANSVSITIAPPSSTPNWIPTTVTIGGAAFRNAWRYTIRLSATPFARRNKMYWVPRTSSIAPRVVRRMYADSPNASASTGSAR